MKEVALKKCRKKYFTQLYISRYPVIPTNPLLAAISFFFSFFFQNTVRLFPKRLNIEKKKLHQMYYCDVRTLQTKSTMYKQCKQNSRNFAKKVLVIKLDPPKISTNRRAWTQATTSFHFLIFFCKILIACFSALHLSRLTFPR